MPDVFQSYEEMDAIELSQCAANLDGQCSALQFCIQQAETLLGINIEKIKDIKKELDART